MIRKILIPEPLHSSFSKPGAVAELLIRAALKIRVGSGIEKELARNSRPVSFVGNKAQSSGQIAARAVASHRKANCIDIEGMSMLCDVERGRVRLFNRYRVTMFGGTVIIGKHDRRVG